MYEGVRSEILYATKLDKNSYSGVTYLHRIDMNHSDKMKTKEKFSISEEGYTVGKLLDGPECQILLEIKARKSLMCKTQYLRCKSLYLLPKFASRKQRIHVGNK